MKWADWVVKDGLSKIVTSWQKPDVNFGRRHIVLGRIPIKLTVNNKQQARGHCSWKSWNKGKNGRK